MLTPQLDKERRQKTFIGSIQSKWKNASLSLEELSFKSMAIALSTILLLGTLGTLLFINMQHPETNNGRDLQSGPAQSWAPLSSTFSVPYASDGSEPLTPLPVPPLPIASLPTLPPVQLPLPMPPSRNASIPPFSLPPPQPISEQHPSDPTFAQPRHSHPSSNTGIQQSTDDPPEIFTAKFETTEISAPGPKKQVDIITLNSKTPSPADEKHFREKSGQPLKGTINRTLMEWSITNLQHWLNITYQKNYECVKLNQPENVFILECSKVTSDDIVRRKDLRKMTDALTSW